MGNKGAQAIHATRYAANAVRLSNIEKRLDALSATQASKEDAGYQTVIASVSKHSTDVESKERLIGFLPN